MLPAPTVFIKSVEQDFEICPATTVEASAMPPTFPPFFRAAFAASLLSSPRIIINP